MKKFLILLGLLASNTAIAGWEASSIEDKLTGKKTAILMLNATETQISPIGWPASRDQTAILMLSCERDHAAIMFTISGRPVARKGTVLNFRIDQSPPMLKQPWTSSTSGQGMGLYNRKAAIPLIEKLTKSESLFIRADDSVLGMTEATFDLKGMEEAFAPMRKNCNP